MTNGLGGLARVSSLRNQLQSRTDVNGPVMILFSGDLISPSALDTAVINGTFANGNTFTSPTAMNGIHSNRAKKQNQHQQHTATPCNEEFLSHESELDCDAEVEIVARRNLKSFLTH